MAKKLFEVEIGEDDELVMRFHRPRAFAATAAGDQLRHSAKDMLMAVRELVDAALNAVDKKDTGEGGPTKIEVK